MDLSPSVLWDDNYVSQSAALLPDAVCEEAELPLV